MLHYGLQAGHGFDSYRGPLCVESACSPLCVGAVQVLIVGQAGIEYGWIGLVQISR